MKAAASPLAVLAMLALLAGATGAAAQSSDDDTALPPVPKPRFTVVDGDTVKFGPQVVRLFGIDAPERSQTCDDGQWRAGTLARKALEEFIAGRPVTCRLVDPDRKTRPPVAQCFAGEDDLQEKMVSAGWAWALPVNGKDPYGVDERDAALRKAGIHAHKCMPPAEWRAMLRREAQKREQGG
ncbi:thermonuclease family protein [Reyranella sp.]|uniref:thermonuclease family protein n=1 Tax=Reyranella sp. TaxID=1929291 RepID=UPI003D0A8EB1